MKRIFILANIFLLLFLLLGCDFLDNFTNTTTTTSSSITTTSDIDSSTTYTTVSETTISDVFTITFIVDGEQSIESVSATYNSEVTLPLAEKPGHTFLGWSLEEDGSTSIIDNLVYVIENVTLYAQWSLNTYNIEYLDSDGELIDLFSVSFGDDLSLLIEPSYPIKEGFSFVEWDSDLPNEMPAEDIVLTAIYRYNEYTISFAATDSIDFDSITEDYGTELTEPEIPIKEGYTFINWYEDSNFNVSFSFVTMLAYDVTLYAKWEINQYTISFESNAGTEVSSFTMDYMASVDEPDEPTKEGYTFVGWFIDTETTLQFTFNTMPAYDVTVYAKWNTNIYILQYIDDDGTVLYTSDCNYGSDLTGIAEPLATKVGYTFNGWDTDCPDTMPANNISIQAEYIINQYTISFDSNGGTEVNSITLDYMANLDEPDEPTKEGYTFINWYEDSNFTVPFTFANIPAYDVTLYAKWEINQYIISFDSNGGTEVSSITQDYMTNLDEPDEPTKEGYTFGGWYSDVNYATAYVFDKIQAENITIYAKWNINAYTLQYIDDDGTVLYIVDYDFDSNLTSIVEPLVSKVGYTFSGWDTDCPDTMPANNLSMLAEYVINQYTVSFETYGGTEVSSITQDYMTVVNEPNEPTQEGYNFIGWFSDAELSIAYIFTTMPAEDTTLYTKWAINQYTLTFDTNEGSLVDSIAQDYNTLVDEPTEPTKEGYTFGGWYSDVNYTTAYVFDKMQAENLTIYAKWNINSYTLQYIDEDGTVLYISDHDYGSNLTGIVKPLPTKVGYTFSGWDIVCPDTMPANNLSIQAEYSINQYTISFDSNGGTEVISITQDYDTTVIEPDEPTKEGYTFDNWFIDSEMTSEYTFNTMPASDATIYAKWTANQYTISFESNGGTETSSITQYYLTTFVEPDEPTKEGYTFEGWFTDSELTLEYTFNTMPAYDATLYAKWEINHYIVTFYDKNEVTILESYITDHGNQMQNPNIPVREGFLFGGYYTENYGQGTMVYDDELNLLIDSTVYGNINLYVNWKIKLNGNSSEGYYIYMGELPDTKYEGIPNGLSSPDPVTGYVTDSQGNRYKLYSGNYYIVEPIKWIVLEQDYVDGKVKLLLISDKIIDVKRYDDDSNDWETSEIRQYLNGPVDLLLSPFGSIVFNPYEIEQILLTTLNADDPVSSTEQYLFLLSYGETLALSLLDTNIEKMALLTAYVDAKITQLSGYGAWWMRYETEDTIGTNNTYIFLVDFAIDVLNVNFTYIGIRPSANISLDYDLIYDVYFDGNGASFISGIEHQIVHHGDTTVPPEYELYGSIFVGWDKNIDPILSNCTITAIWEEIIITHEFESEYGELISGLELQVISLVDEPEYPVYYLEGNSISSWQITYDELTSTYNYLAVWANP
ncbi:MAG: InlB B-repeat-containing protein, partial [Tenericutes bacterium]|nr:InlB B-repeat-containing protein [Mycoplasmatota bacterium]